MIIENYLIEDDWTKLRLNKTFEKLIVVNESDGLINTSYYNGSIVVRHSTTNSFCIDISCIPFRRNIFLKFYPNYYLKYFGTAEQAMSFIDNCLEKIKRLIIFS